MRYLVFLLAIAAMSWSMQCLAVDIPMKFAVKNLGPQSVEKSVSWNPTTQEAMVRIGLVPTSISPILADKTFSLSSAKQVQVIPLDYPEMAEGCSQVTQWAFEYQPGFPDYLMYITLKGPTCEKLGNYLEMYNTRFRFVGVSALNSDPVDVAVEVSR